MNTYILVWYPWKGETSIRRQDILDALDKNRFVANWRASTGAIFIGSDANENRIADEISEKLPDLEFIISKIDLSTSQGRTDKETWSFIGNPMRPKMTK